MSFFRLIRSGLTHHWRAHLGALLGTVLCSMVLTGSLLVGDSLRGTLRSHAQARVGRVESALVGGETLFRSALAEAIGPKLAPALLLRGSVAKPDGKARINQVQVLGVDSRFWELAPAADRRELQPGDAVVNTALAARLGIALGESLIVRVEKPSLFSRDAPLSGEEEVIESLRVRVVAFADDAHFGRFGLQATQIPPATVFLPLELTQQRLEAPGKANLLLSAAMGVAELQAAVIEHWQLEDAGLQTRPDPSGHGTELRTPRVFFEDSLVQKLPPATQALTYFVNSIRSGDQATPYSMVTAAPPGSLPFLPADLRENEVVISEWLAEDLGVQPGDPLDLSYFVMGERRTLEERSQTFQIRGVASKDDPAWNPSWMPDFPGLADVGNCRDWKPGFALSLDRIRDKDEAYWKQYRGTPKLFLSLEQGKKMWANRWGKVTSLRYTTGTLDNPKSDLLKTITPADVGFQFVPLRAQAMEATHAPVDFAGLFAGFSFFLIVSALVLVGLLFGLMVEKRTQEAGTLLALGWPARTVRSLFLWEGIGLVSIGSLLGGGLGVLYTRAILSALRSIWSDAVSGSEIRYFGDPLSLAFGIGGSSVAAWIAIAWVGRRSFRKAPRSLLAGEAPETSTTPAPLPPLGKKARGMALISALGALALWGGALWRKNPEPLWFFCGGALWLVALLFGVRWLLRRWAKGRMSAPRHLAWRNLGRRFGRTLVLVGVLASGSFLVLSVEVFRKAPAPSGLPRQSGTGGFALFGELATPVYEDLNRTEVRDLLALPKETGVRALMLRKKEGDEASCLNLNRAIQPQILGVPSEELADLGAFRFASQANWRILQTEGEGWIPVVADEATLLWALQKRIGDEIRVPDGLGGEVRLRLVAALSGSILQGSLLMDQKAFERVFPQLGGYRVLLLDAPAGKEESTRAAWSRALADRGLELNPAAQRLAELDAVANAYLSIFQVLGGLGVLLGAVGGGVVAARNVVDRRGELALLQATGWSWNQVRRLLLSEHCLQIFLGITVGGICAWLTTVPRLEIQGEPVAWTPMFAWLFVLASTSLLSVGIAVRMAMPKRLLEALRSE